MSDFKEHLDVHYGSRVIAYHPGDKRGAAVMPAGRGFIVRAFTLAEIGWIVCSGQLFRDREEAMAHYMSTISRMKP